MVGTFPLNVQAGSPQYTLASQITPSSSTSLITITNTDSIDPINNAYYTIQNEDGSKWCTFYVGQWTTVSSNNYTGSCTYSSSNTSDVFPEGSVCWCVWTKEYYESITTSISTVNTEISTVNNEIDTLTPKVDNSFVSATKTNDTTLRLTRNDGTTVDINFPKGVNVRFISGEDVSFLSSKLNELVVIESCYIRTLPGTSITNVTIKEGLGYLKSSNVVIATDYNVISINPVEQLRIPATGLLYNGASISRTRA